MAVKQKGYQRGPENSESREVLAIFGEKTQKSVRMAKNPILAPVSGSRASSPPLMAALPRDAKLAGGPGQGRPQAGCRQGGPQELSVLHVSTLKDHAPEMRRVWRL